MKGLDENLFKGAIKRKTKFTTSIFVKFLITGVVALSLTACGGGGGGGGSSSSDGSGNGGVTVLPGVDNIGGGENIQNKEEIFKEDILVVDKPLDYAGLKAENSSNVTIDSSATINVSSEHGVTGVLATNNSKITNKGTIRVKTNYLHESEINYDEDNFNTQIKYAGKGILITDKSTGINEKNIEIEGSTLGIVAYGNGSTGINKGNIKLLGKGSTWEELPTIGMAGFEGGKVVNEQGGVIAGEVYGAMGMFGYKGHLVNNGTIQLGENDNYGMVVQDGTIENNGKIILSHGIGRDPIYDDSIVNTGMEVATGKAINRGTIEINNEYSEHPSYNTGRDLDDIADIAIYGSDGAEIINEKTGVINITGSTAGMMVDGEYEGINKAVNNGIINITSSQAQNNFDPFTLIPTIGMLVEDGGRVENNNKITGSGNSIIGINATLESDQKHKINTVVNNGNIDLTGSYLFGIKGIGNITNNGNISIKGKKKNEINSYITYIAGIDVESGTVVNNGKIEAEGHLIVGINGYDSNIINKNLISLNGTLATGILDGCGGKIVNEAKIEMTGQEVEGIYVENGSKASNHGTITINGTDSFGMSASGSSYKPQEIVEVRNEVGGIINVNGYGSYGMKANGDGAKALNYGTINVGDTAAGGMYASYNGTIANYGVINISKNNSTAEALFAENGGVILNRGTINSNADVTIKTSGTYVIDTDNSGNYGRLSAKNVNLSGDVVVKTDIVKGNYKKEHVLQNVVEAENINVGETVNFKSNSLLYTASAEKDVFGNLDAKLERNSNNVSDFADKKFVGVSSIFDDYINNENEYNKLTLAGKEVIDTIFDVSTSRVALESAVNQVVGTEYLNVQKQIFDIKDSFKEYDNSVISTLDKYGFNFQFMGEYSELDSKNGISGYESKLTGFNGAAKLSDNLYGVLGYGYSDIDYDGKSEGKIQTIHTGVYKDLAVNGYDLRLGVYGEYNFHENDRAVFNRMAESEFNSYLAGVSGEISKKYGTDLYIKPSISLDIAYGNIESFNEDKADGFNLNVDEQDYTSVVPEARIDLGKEFTNSRLFASVGYSYELGDMDKDMRIELLNKKADVKNNEMEHGKVDMSVGGSVIIKNLSLSAELGKEFGRRDREYVRAGFSYRF